MRATNLLRSLFTSNAQPRQRTVRLGLDNLERRDTPAGTVTSSLSANGKTWTIIGDDADNDITITNDPNGNGAFSLIGNGTTIDGEAAPTGVENIVMKMFKGADSVTMNTTGDPGTLVGNLTIQGGNGANYVYLTNMTFNKNVTITNLANNPNQDQIWIEDCNINGNVSVTNGNGNSFTTLYRTTPGINTVGGNLKVTNGTGNGEVWIADMNIGGNVNVTNGVGNSVTYLYNTSGTTNSVSGNVTVTNSTGTDDVRLTDINVTGNVNIKNGEGNTTTYLSRSTAGESIIGGNVNIMSGTGYDDVQVIDVNVNKNVKINNGAPDSNNQPGQTQFYNTLNTTGQSTIQGNIKVNYSGGLNSGNERDGLWDYDVQGNVSFNYGSGQGDVRFDGYNVAEPAMIHGNLTIKSAGALVATVASQGYTNQGLWVGGKLTINSGAEGDTLLFYNLIVDGSTMIKTGDGNDSVTIDDSVFAQFTLNTLAGNDTVLLDYWDNTPGTTQFTGVVSVNLGNGDDQLTLGYPGDNTALVAFSAVATFLGGNGSDTITNDNTLALNGDPITILA